MSSSADWEEVKRLASDFQRAQLSSAAYKLSERNVVEIVNKLTEAKLLDILFTNDGKEYVTPSHLTKEITDELYVEGGRVALTDLVCRLNVSFSAIEARAHELVGSNRGLHLVLGQLIEDDTYLDRIGHEINEKLQQHGHIDVADLSRSFELPPEFLIEQIVKRLGTAIYGHQDDHNPQNFFTEGYVSRNKARIRGVLSAVTKPISCGSIINAYSFPDRLFYNIVEELVRTNRLAGSLSGPRSSGKTLYTPSVYSKAQNDWVTSFFKQNGYLEYDSLTRLGISDPVPYIKKQFSSETMKFLPSCCVGQVLTAQVEAAVEEALASGGWADIMPILPSVLSSADGKKILTSTLEYLTPQTGKKAQVFGDTVVVTEQLMEKLQNTFVDMMKKKADEEIKSGTIQQFMVDQKASAQGKMKMEEEMVESKKDKREDRRKRAAGGKGGGGTQGRETKTKSTKKKGGRNRAVEVDSEDEGDKTKNELEFMSLEELEESLRCQACLQECPDELFSELSEHLCKPLCHQYTDIAKEAFLSSLASNTEQRRKTHSQLVDKLNSLLVNIRLFIKGLKPLDDEELSTQLSKHLLKTHCTDIVTDVVTYIATETSGKDVTEAATTEARTKLINKFPEAARPPLLSLNKCLSGSNVEEFLEKLDACLSLDCCDIMLRKPDKKKEKSQLSEMRAQLTDQLHSCDDPALVLHLSVLILYLNQNGAPVHASGKFVPALLPLVGKQISTEQSQLLFEYQNLVMKTLKDSDGQSEAVSKLNSLTAKVKEVVQSSKKGS